MPYDGANYRDKLRLDRMAESVRGDLGLRPTDLLNLQQLADAVPAHIFIPEDLVSAELAADLRLVAWDGFAFQFPDEDALMILLNPARSEKRQCATVLEEIGHYLLKHPPSSIFADPQTGILRRSYLPAQEREAYDFGATLLLPKEFIQQHVKVAKGTAADLADQCGCSTELVEFRIKRCRLWNRYLANTA